MFCLGTSQYLAYMTDWSTRLTWVWKPSWVTSVFSSWMIGRVVAVAGPDNLHRGGAGVLAARVVLRDVAAMLADGRLRDRHGRLPPRTSSIPASTALISPAAIQARAPTGAPCSKPTPPTARRSTQPGRPTPQATPRATPTPSPSAVTSTGVSSWVKGRDLEQSRFSRPREDVTPCLRATPYWRIEARRAERRPPCVGRAGPKSRSRAGQRRGGDARRY